MLARPSTWIPKGSTTTISLSGRMTGLSAGAHTLKLQAWHGASGVVDADAVQTNSSEACNTQLEIVVG